MINLIKCLKVSAGLPTDQSLGSASRSDEEAACFNFGELGKINIIFFSFFTIGKASEDKNKAMKPKKDLRFNLHNIVSSNPCQGEIFHFIQVVLFEP
jgi:hypothetical protein